MIVYELEWRMQEVFMHWFLFVVSGLNDVPKGSNFHTKITEEFQRDTLPLLEPDYHYVEPRDGDTIIKIHGAPLVGDRYVAPHYYRFVREQILVKNHLEADAPPTRLLYISRGKANTLGWRRTYAHKTTKRLINEDELLEKLIPLGFECIYLEDYSLLEKIQLFQEAKVIVAPSGGGFTTCFFGNLKTHIIELRADTQDHYHHICIVLGIPITVYTCHMISDPSEDIIVPNVSDLATLCSSYI